MTPEAILVSVALLVFISTAGYVWLNRGPHMIIVEEEGFERFRKKVRMRRHKRVEVYPEISDGYYFAVAKFVKPRWVIERSSVLKKKIVELRVPDEKTGAQEKERREMAALLVSETLAWRIRVAMSEKRPTIILRDFGGKETELYSEYWGELFRSAKELGVEVVYDDFYGYSLKI